MLVLRQETWRTCGWVSWAGDVDENEKTEVDEKTPPCTEKPSGLGCPPLHKLSHCPPPAGFHILLNSPLHSTSSQLGPHCLLAFARLSPPVSLPLIFPLQPILHTTAKQYLSKMQA